MKCKYLFVSLFVLFSSVSNAQWAVYDDELHKQLAKINKIKNIDDLGPGKTYDNFESERLESGDIQMGSGVDAALLKGLDTKFENLTDLTEEEKAKYVGAVADCGSKETSAKHWLQLQVLVDGNRRPEKIAAKI